MEKVAVAQHLGCAFEGPSNLGEPYKTHTISLLNQDKPYKPHYRFIFALKSQALAQNLSEGFRGRNAEAA